MNDTTNKTKKWKKQKIGLDTITRAVRKERSRSWRNSSRNVKKQWNRVITVLEMICPYSNKFEMVKNIKLTNVESTCKRHKEHNRKGIIEEYQQRVHSKCKYKHACFSYLSLICILSYFSVFCFP